MYCYITTQLSVRMRTLVVLVGIVAAVQAGVLLNEWKRGKSFGKVYADKIMF